MARYVRRRVLAHAGRSYIRFRWGLPTSHIEITLPGISLLRIIVRPRRGTARYGARLRIGDASNANETTAEGQVDDHLIIVGQDERFFLVHRIPNKTQSKPNQNLDVDKGQGISNTDWPCQ